MGMSLREELKKAAKLQTKKVQLSHGEITVTELSAKDRLVVLDYLQAVIDLQNKGTAKAQHYSTLTLTVVCAGLRDEKTGELEFKVENTADRDELMSLCDGNVAKIYDAICEISGLDHMKKDQPKKATG